MNARKTTHITAKGTDIEWAEVLEDLEIMEEDSVDGMNDGTKYLMIAIKNALK